MFQTTTSAFSRAVWLLLVLTACGTKPDGTPYGVNPAKHPDGHILPGHAVPKAYNNKIPKGAELNAVTNGARTGQPTALPPPEASQ